MTSGKYQYLTQGTCSRLIEIEIEEGRIRNLQGIAALVKGMRPEDVAGRLRGIRCGSKSTSCPDQLAKALEEIIGNR